MTSNKDAGWINLSVICKDHFLRNRMDNKCHTFLTEVKVPSGWEKYSLDKNCPSHKYRLEILKKFIDRKETEGFFITNEDTFQQFFNELEQFSADSIPELESVYDLRRKRKVYFFEQNFKVQGVVLRIWKSSRNLKASVLIKTESCSKEGGNASGEFPLFDELVVKVQDEGELSEGDAVEVTKCVRSEGEAWEPEVIKYYYLSEARIESFLKLLSSCLQSDGSTAAVTEITRCRAAWNYTLELSKEKYSTEMTLQILEIIDKICSTAQMPYTVSEIVKDFQRSDFFRKVLCDFIENVTEESSISLLQKILKHVISVIPSSGLRVLPMATILARKLVDSDSGQAAIDFFATVSTIIASKVPGAREDLKAVPWKELPLIPDVDEIRKPVNERLRTEDLLPVIREKGMYKSEEEYLDTYFRLLREECFYKLRKGISYFVNNGQKCDSKDMIMYRISLRGACTHHEDFATDMLVSLEYEVLGTQAKTESEHANTCKLMHGNLLCISMDGSFQEPVWVVVEEHIAEQRIINVTLCNKANTILEPEFVVKMQEITNKSEKAFMAESQTFYVSYAPAMEVLQQRDCVPFKEFLVKPDPNYTEPAEYISKIKAPPDWEIIFQRDSLLECSGQVESSEPYSVLDNFDKLRQKCKAILDDTQLRAVELALRNKVMLIQGPPGTGKSFVGVALVRLLLSMKVPQDYGPILVVTYKNHALDNFLKDCLSKVSPEVKIVRVGSLPEGADEDLKKCLLSKVASRSWPEKLFKQKRKLIGQIWALQRQVNEAFEKLRSSCFFNAEMFMQEASPDQLKFLLVDNKEQSVTEADVEELIKELPKTQTRLKELVEKALKDWLPPQKMFDDFGGEKKESSQENSSVESDQEKATDVQDQLENPNDSKDPSAEKKELLFAIDEEIADEEDKEIAKTTSKQYTSSLPFKKSAMRHLHVMDKSEVGLFVDILGTRKLWKLNPSKRVQLVYVFQSKFYSKARQDYLDVSKVYSQLHHQLKELKNHHDVEVMKKRHIIGMTVTGATMRANLLADVKPSVMIVEEAAEILEGQLVAVIPPSLQHLIMIGDHKQLRPVVHFHRLKKRNHLDLSMFERLVNCKLPFTQLKQQCRMRDEFADLLRKLKIYDELKTNHELVKDNEPPSCVTSCMYFWTHTVWESESETSHSKRNSHEAKEITRVAKTFCQDGGVLPSKITVLCSYRGQVEEIKNHFRKSEVAALEDIAVTTIDSFQGQENDIILISLVRSNPEGKIGYLSSMNRLCVAISRARCGLYLFGNSTHLARASSKGWRVVSDCMRRNEKKCHGGKFPFDSSEDSKPPRHVQSQLEGSFPTRETESIGNVTYITANQVNVNITAGDNAVNTINTSPVSPSDTTSPPRLDIKYPGSGKTPVHDPRTPTTGYVPPTVGPSPTQEVGSPPKEAKEPIQGAGEPVKEADSSNKEARESIQETGKPVKEADSSNKEAREPIQEAGKPVKETDSSNKEAREPIQVAGEPVKETDSSNKEAREPIQEAGEPVKETDSSNKEAREPIQVAGEPVKETDSSNKEAREPIQEAGEPVKETDSSNKEAREPIQEAGEPVKETDSSNKEAREPIQEADEPVKETNSSNKEAREPIQEAGEPVKEADAANKEARESIQEAGEPVKEADSSNKEAREPIQEAGELVKEADSSNKEARESIHEADESNKEADSPILVAGSPNKEAREPIQEAGEPNKKEDTSNKEAREPIQEASEADKEADPSNKEAREPIKEAGETDKAADPSNKEAREPIQEAGEHDKGVGSSNKEAREHIQEVGKPNKEAESPTKEVREPIQEANSPTEEAGLPAQETAGGETCIDPAEVENRTDVSGGKPPRATGGKSQGETETVKVETETSKEEVLSTQETMAAGKRPFEETGLEVGVKGHATDEQE